jgi:hypothetical protein
MPEARAFGRSRFSPLRLIRLSLDGLTAFTTWPLRAKARPLCLVRREQGCGLASTRK